MTNSIGLKNKSLISLILTIFSLPVVLLDPRIGKFLFILISIVVFLEILKGNWIDTRIGLIAFTTIYYFGTYINFFFLKNFHFTSGPISYVMSNEQINFLSLHYVVVFQLGILVSYFSKDISFNRIKKDDLGYYKNFFLNWDFFLTAKFGLPVLLIVLFIDSLSLDWSRIRSEYTLESMSTIFFWLYLIFSLIALRLLYKNFLNKKRIYFEYFLVFVLLIFMNYLGVRQVLVWGLLTVIISYFFYLFKVKKVKLDFKNNIFYSVLLVASGIALLLLINISFLFRHQKTEMINILFNLSLAQLFKALLNGFIAETTFTTYNLLAVVDNILKGNSMFPFKNIFDFFIMIVPSFLYPEKYNMIYFSEFSRQYNVTPFGTWFIVGQFASSFKYPFFVFLSSYTYSTLQIKILEFLWKKSNLMIEYCLFYGLTYVFTSLYVVRGITEGGLKVCLTIFIGLYFFKFVLRFIKKSIRVTNFKIEKK